MVAATSAPGIGRGLAEPGRTGHGSERHRGGQRSATARPPRPAGEVWRGLLDRGVLVRDLSGQVPNCLRVTAGTAEEVDAFLAALTEVLA